MWLAGWLAGLQEVIEAYLSDITEKVMKPNQLVVLFQLHVGII
jgi:hypothetical protein